jgi:hypothetical protein
LTSLYAYEYIAAMQGGVGPAVPKLVSVVKPVLSLTQASVIEKNHTPKLLTAARLLAVMVLKPRFLMMVGV